MRTFFFMILLSSLALTGFKGNDGYSVIRQCYGYIDADSVMDKVVILEAQDTKQLKRNFCGEMDDVEGKERVLKIFIGDKDKSFHLKASSANAVLLSSEGGIKGDPLGGISVKDHVITINFSGGSADLWHLTYRFKLQNNDFILIGATNKGNVGKNSYSYDWNLLTQSFLYKPAEGKEKKEKLVPSTTYNLNDFHPWFYKFDQKCIF